MMITTLMIKFVRPPTTMMMMMTKVTSNRGSMLEEKKSFLKKTKTSKFLCEFFFCRKYDGLSSSALQPLKNEPYYLARQLQPRIKKYIKKLIGMDKAYCFGELRFRCEKFVCHALRALEQGQFADHINLKACEDIAEPDKMDLQQLKKEHGEFNWSIPNKKSVFTVFKKWSEGVKKFCHKTAHTTDDRCKNKVECLMIEGLKSAWPELVDTKDCGPNALAQYEVKQSTNKVDRALRQKAKKEN